MSGTGTGLGYRRLNQMTRVKISDARMIAKKLDQQAVVILGVERDGTVTVVTYGENKEKCKAIGDWGQGLWKYAVSLIPFQTVFGWGNGGVPKPVERLPSNG